jgi:hypothetical protein
MHDFAGIAAIGLDEEGHLMLATLLAYGSSNTRLLRFPTKSLS